MTGSRAAEAARIPSLDGLRSLVLLILFIHFVLNPARGWDGWSRSAFMAAGYLAVTALDVFFVLSGFLITGILLNTKHSETYFRSFYLRRLVRILPLYYGFLVVYLIVIPKFAPWDSQALVLTPWQQSYYWAYFVNIAYALHWQLAAFTGHLWTLSIEEQFYLAWPVVVWLCNPSLLKRVCVACLVMAPLVRLAVSVVFPDTALFYTFTFARMDGLAMGALIAVFWHDRRNVTGFVAGIRKGAVGAAGVALAIIVVGLKDPSLVLEPGFQAASYLTVSVYCAAGVVVATLCVEQERLWHRIVRSWPLRQIGIYSYAIYVLHNPLSYVLHQSGVLERPPVGATIGSALWYFLVMTVVTVAVSALSWHLFEKPLLRLRPASPIKPRREASAPEALTPDRHLI